MARDNKRYGPFTWPQMCQRAGDGRLFRADMVHREGGQKWKPASDVEGLFPPHHPARTGRRAWRPVVFGGAATFCFAAVAIGIWAAVASGPKPSLAPAAADRPRGDTPPGAPENDPKNPTPSEPAPVKAEADDLQGLWVVRKAGGEIQEHIDQLQEQHRRTPESYVELAASGQVLLGVESEFRASLAATLADNLGDDRDGRRAAVVL